ncbi:HNH endonuclease [Arthrobacter frigidicola]|nr:HNH endonuclease [Arthrobacter frigidicola]
MAIPTLRTVDIERFWAKVDKAGGCWTWTASKTSTGYGVVGLWRDGRTIMVKAHRMSYFLANGADPAGMDIDHTCHNTLCVNPEHLREATHKQNMEHRAAANTGNVSGVRGVHWAARYQKWEAQVKHHGKSLYLGRYDTVPEAESVVVAKRLELFSHNDADRAVA